jgi:hypothetical protein
MRDDVRYQLTTALHQNIISYWFSCKGCLHPVSLTVISPCFNYCRVIRILYQSWFGTVQIFGE